MASRPFSSIRRFMIRRLAPIARHPAATLFTGVALVLTGIVEFLEEMITDFETVIAGYHGLLVLGAVTILRGLAEIIEGTEWMSRGAEEDVEEKERTIPV